MKDESETTGPVYLFRGVELKPIEGGTMLAAQVGPVWVTLTSVAADAGPVEHHASATLLDADTGGRVHVQAKDQQRGPALGKLDSLLKRFGMWAAYATPRHKSPFPQTIRGRPMADYLPPADPERDADASDADAARDANPPGWDLTP